MAHHAEGRKHNGCLAIISVLVCFQGPLGPRSVVCTCHACLADGLDSAAALLSVQGSKVASREEVQRTEAA